jgi:hypothetical protein
MSGMMTTAKLFVHAHVDMLANCTVENAVSILLKTLVVNNKVTAAGVIDDIAQQTEKEGIE